MGGVAALGGVAVRRNSCAAPFCRFFSEKFLAIQPEIPGYMARWLYSKTNMAKLPVARDYWLSSTAI